MIGISTTAFIGESLDFALESIEYYVDFAEIFSEGRHDLFENSSILSSYNLKYSVHSPTVDINIASVREKTRITSLDIISDLADLCASYNITTMVVHPGYTSEDYMLPKAYSSLEKSLDFLNKLSENTGVCICVENMPNYFMYLFQNPKDIDLKNNNFVLDVGHANITGNLSEFLKMNIDHFHIHDNFGESDDHLAIGDGNTDFSKVFDKIKNSKAHVILENKSIENAKKSLDIIKSKI